MGEYVICPSPMKLSVVLKPVPGNQELEEVGNPPGRDHDADSVRLEEEAADIAVVVVAAHRRPLTGRTWSGVAIPPDVVRATGVLQEPPLSVDLDITVTPELSLFDPRRYTAPPCSKRVPRRMPLRSLPPLTFVHVTPLSVERKIRVLPFVLEPDADPKSAWDAR